jgi:hypothetical protein
MIRGKRFGILVLVSLMLLNVLNFAAWAQSPAPVAEPSEGQKNAAGMADIVYVPAKTLFCIGSGVSWLGVLILSGGTAYNMATDVVRAGCGGKWVLHGEDIQYSSSTAPVKAR